MYWDRLQRRSMSRRRLIIGAGALGAGAGALTLVGCGGGESGTKPSTEGPSGPPVAGGTLRYSTGATPRTLNPFKEVSGNTMWIIGPNYNGLIKPDPLDQGKTLVSDMATKWEQPDPTTYTFTISSNAVFHDGTTIGRAAKAQDVVVSLNRQIAPSGRPATPRTGLITAIDRIEAPNDTTVVFKMKRPSASFLRLLAVGWFVVVPEEIVQDENQLDNKIIGTGPFMLQSFDSRTGAKLVKNPQYFKAGRPYLDAIEIPIISDNNTRVSAFATGQQDIHVENLNASQRQIIGKGPDLIWDESQDPISGPAFHIAVRTPPFTDVRVRQAINAAINREETFAVNLPECPMLFASPLGLSKWALPQEEMAKRQGNRIKGEKLKDIQDAKQLMQAAGFDKGFECEIVIGESAGVGTSLGPDAVGLVVAQNISAIGIKGNPVKYEYPTAFQRRVFPLTYELASYGISFPAPDPSGLALLFGANAGRNYSGIIDPELDRMIEQQEQALDETARLKLVQDLQRKILDTHSGLYFTMEKPCAGRIPRRTYVHNWSTNWDYFRYDGMRMEDVWMEKRR